MTSKLPPEISLYEIMLNNLPYTPEDIGARPVFPKPAPPMREFTALLMRTLARLNLEYPPIPAQATSQPSTVTVITDQASAKFAQDVAREVSLVTAGPSKIAQAAARLETTITAELPDGRTASVSTLATAEEPVIRPSADQPGVYTILGAKNDEGSITPEKIAPLTFEPSEAEVVARIAAPEDVLAEFKEGQWWVRELDHMAGHNPGGGLARAVAVVHNLLRASLDYQSEHGDAENVIRQQAARIESLQVENDRLRAPGHQPYPEMPPADLEHNSYSRAAVKAAMKDAHDRGYSVGWDHGHEHAVKESAPAVVERKPDGKRPDLDWLEDVQVTDTIGRGWCVRIDGTDIFEDANRHGCKGRKSFQIASGCTSKQEAERAALEWLDRQRAGLASTPVADAAPEYAYSDDGKTVTMTNVDRAPSYRAGTPVAGHAFRALLDRSKVPGKDYLYCIKPSEIDAAIGEASAPTAAESLNRCEQSTPALMESNNGAARVLADITLTGTTPAERFNEERKHFAWNKP